MTEALTIIPPEPTLRFIDTAIGKVIPVVDIADNIKYSRSAISNTIARNKDLFEGFTSSEPLSTKGGTQKFLCVNSIGLDRLLMLIRPIKNRKELFERSEIFKAKAFKQLAELKETPKTKEVIVPTDPQLASSLGNRVTDQLQIADAMARYANVDRGIAVSMALSKVQFDTGIDLAMWKNLVVKGKPSKRIGLLLATEIGVMLGFGDNAGNSVNKVLNKLGYLNWVGHWALTQRGETYAEVFPRTGISPAGTSWSRYEIKWQPEMVEILRKHLFQEVPKPDQGLLTGYI